jgi:hypothetical protein
MRAGDKDRGELRAQMATFSGNSGQKKAKEKHDRRMGVAAGKVGARSGGYDERGSKIARGRFIVIGAIVCRRGVLAALQVVW